MIVVDTSALIAIIKREPLADVCSAILESDPIVIISAGTLTEARIVAIRGGRDTDLDKIIDASIAEIIPLTADRARFASDVYSVWGKGFHKAALNFGDDFAQTDVSSAISAIAT